MQHTAKGIAALKADVNRKVQHQQLAIVAAFLCRLCQTLFQTLRQAATSPHGIT